MPVIQNVINVSVEYDCRYLLPFAKLRPNVIQRRARSQPFELIARHRVLRRDFERLSSTRRDFDPDSGVGST